MMNTLVMTNVGDEADDTKAYKANFQIRNSKKSKFQIRNLI
jgi:hypothetical protein